MSANKANKAPMGAKRKADSDIGASDKKAKDGGGKPENKAEKKALFTIGSSFSIKTLNDRAHGNFKLPGPFKVIKEIQDTVAKFPTTHKDWNTQSAYEKIQSITRAAKLDMPELQEGRKELHNKQPLICAMLKIGRYEWYGCAENIESATSAAYTEMWKTFDNYFIKRKPPTNKPGFRQQNSRSAGKPWPPPPLMSLRPMGLLGDYPAEEDPSYYRGDQGFDYYDAPGMNQPENDPQFEAAMEVDEQITVTSRRLDNINLRIKDCLAHYEQLEHEMMTAPQQGQDLQSLQNWSMVSRIREQLEKLYEDEATLKAHLKNQLASKMPEGGEQFQDPGHGPYADRWRVERARQDRAGEWFGDEGLQRGYEEVNVRNYQDVYRGYDNRETVIEGYKDRERQGRSHGDEGRERQEIIRGGISARSRQEATRGGVDSRGRHEATREGVNSRGRHEATRERSRQETMRENVDGRGRQEAMRGSVSGRGHREVTPKDIGGRRREEAEGRGYDRGRKEVGVGEREGRERYEDNNRARQGARGRGYEEYQKGIESRQHGHQEPNQRKYESRGRGNLEDSKGRNRQDEYGFLGSGRQESSHGNEFVRSLERNYEQHAVSQDHGRFSQQETSYGRRDNERKKAILMVIKDLEERFDKKLKEARAYEDEKTDLIGEYTAEMKKTRDPNHQHVLSREIHKVKEELKTLLSKEIWIKRDYDQEVEEIKKQFLVSDSEFKSILSSLNEKSQPVEKQRSMDDLLKEQEELQEKISRIERWMGDAKNPAMADYFRQERSKHISKLEDLKTEIDSRHSVSVHSRAKQDGRGLLGDYPNRGEYRQEKENDLGRYRQEEVKDRGRYQQDAERFRNRTNRNNDYAKGLYERRPEGTQSDSYSSQMDKRTWNQQSGSEGAATRQAASDQTLSALQFYSSHSGSNEMVASRNSYGKNRETRPPYSDRFQGEKDWGVQRQSWTTPEDRGRGAATSSPNFSFLLTSYAKGNAPGDFSF